MAEGSNSPSMPGTPVPPSLPSRPQGPGLVGQRLRPPGYLHLGSQDNIHQLASRAQLPEPNRSQSCVPELQSNTPRPDSRLSIHDMITQRETVERAVSEHREIQHRMSQENIPPVEREFPGMIVPVRPRMPLADVGSSAVLRPVLASDLPEPVRTAHERDLVRAAELVGRL